MFQFQCGAIGSTAADWFAKNATKFQFQCGAIGSVWGLPSFRGIACFNSSVVRLEARTSRRAASITLFQFQCGAIGSQLFAYTASTLVAFQFQCGAIGSRKDS